MHIHLCAILDEFSRGGDFLEQKGCQEYHGYLYGQFQDEITYQEQTARLHFKLKKDGTPVP